jgi:Xaa-Pro aminopeptidase
MQPEIYARRREILQAAIPGDAVLLLGNSQSPRNYKDNTYPFRQSSHLLYYSGLTRPDVALLLLPDGTTELFAAPANPDDMVWSGPQATRAELARQAGIEIVQPLDDLAAAIHSLVAHGLGLHTLPPVRGETSLWLARLIAPASMPDVVSQSLVTAVVAQRSVKSDDEIASIESALELTARMHAVACTLTRPEVSEACVEAAMQQVALEALCHQSYPPIVSVRGEILHGAATTRPMQAGELLMIDAGAENRDGYASDITRVLPVSGHFTDRQRDIYRIVLDAQLAAIATIKPGVNAREVHLTAARHIAQGLIDLGLIRGSADNCVEQGAHALFFCHGIGHMLGLDVHDMEDLGDTVGYEPGEKRSKQFGLSFLRFARTLKPGFVMTVEPGIYFNEALISRWKAENRLADVINYDKLDPFIGMGGVRIEDDILVTETGRRVLGPSIPKTPDDVENAMRA